MDVLWIVIAAFIGNLLYQISNLLQQSGTNSWKSFGVTLITSLVVGLGFGLSYNFITPGTLTALDILTAVMGGYIAANQTQKIVLARASRNSKRG